MKNNKRGLIDTCGKVLLPCIYDDITISKNSVFVKRNNKWGLMYPMGHIVVPPKYDNYSIDFIVELNKRGLYIFCQGENMFIFNSTGKKILNGKYDFNEDYYFINSMLFFYPSSGLILGKEGKWGVFNF